MKKPVEARAGQIDSPPRHGNRGPGERGKKVIITFFREIEAARREYAAKGGVPLEEARRRIPRWVGEPEQIDELAHGQPPSGHRQHSRVKVP